jgi:hypothetical protein
MEKVGEAAFCNCCGENSNGKLAISAMALAAVMVTEGSLTLTGRAENKACVVAAAANASFIADFDNVAVLLVLVVVLVVALVVGIAVVESMGMSKSGGV